VTNPSRRIRVFVGALCSASLALALVADAAAATPTERTRKRRRAPVDQELDKGALAWPAQAPAGVGLPPARVRQPDAAQKRVVAPAAAVADPGLDGATTLAIVKRAAHAGFRGGYRLPYPPGTPVSPSR
jgi:hypothetical protein